MHRTYGFNSRLCDSGSKLSGRIERQKSEVLIALPTNEVAVQLNEKLVTPVSFRANTGIGLLRCNDGGIKTRTS